MDAEHIVNGQCGTYRVRPLDGEWVVDYRPFGESGWPFSSYDTVSNIADAMAVAEEWDAGAARRLSA